VKELKRDVETKVTSSKGFPLENIKVGASCCGGGCGPTKRKGGSNMENLLLKNLSAQGLGVRREWR